MPAAAVSLMGTMVASRSASKAGRMALEGQQGAMAQREKFFDIGREDLAPYREIGNEAVDKMRSVFLEGNMDEFFESPDYGFRVSEGEKALERKQGQSGSRFGGKALKDAVRFGQEAGSQEFNNFFNRLRSISGLGASAAAGSANLAAGTGAGMASDVRTGTAGQVDAVAGQNQAIQGGFSNLMTLKTYNDLTKSLQPQPMATAQPNYDSGSVTSMPSIFNK